MRLNFCKYGQAIMHLVLSAIFLCGAVEIHASEKPIANFMSQDREKISIFQKDQEYGLDLIIIKNGSEPRKRKEIKRIPNVFGVALDNPSIIFMCWIANGLFSPENFQILEIRTFKSKILKLVPEPMGDELRCLIEENEKYFIIYDDFPGRNLTYLFDNEGQSVGVIKGKFKSSIEIEGRVYNFLKGKSFGGFTEN